MPNDPDDIDPSGYTIVLDGSKSSGNPARFSWTLESAGEERGYISATPSAVFTGVKPGNYNAKLKVIDALGHSASHVERVQVRNLLIVSLGDSYASGEGNPEVSRHDLVPEFWADSPDSRARHFSSLAAPAQAALRVASAFPKTAVTFVSLASSGATIREGLLGPQSGKELVDSPDGRLPAQIQRLRSLIGSRKIDLLLVSIGGNDAGFVSVVHDLVEHDSHPFAPDVADIKGDVDDRLVHLKTDFRDLADQIKLLPVAPEHVLLTEYPDPFYDKSGAVLPHDILEDAADSNLEWLGVSWNLANASLSPNEMQDARNIFVHPLNQLLREIAKSNGWGLVSLQEAFQGRGYSDDADSGIRWSWIVTFKDSVAREGCMDGTLHPNSNGHAALAEKISGTMMKSIQAEPPR